MTGENLHGGDCGEAKTTEFIASLSGMGWNCGTASMPVEDAEMDDAEPETTDDTDDLAPAEEEIELPDPEPATD